MKPFISIITPAHRIIPWLNARLISVCEQTFDDWEWLILDNSTDGCVKKYVDDFFKSMHGVAYPQCREKIKCWHEPLPMVRIEDGRMGILRNWLVKNTNCRDDGFIVTLDSDDFIFQDLLENIYKARERHPSTEIMTGLCQQGLYQYVQSGKFGWFDDQYVNFVDHNKWQLMEKCGCASFTGWDEFKELYINGKRQAFKHIEKYNCLKIPHTELMFESNRITTLGGKGYGLFMCIKHPIIYRKDAFLKKIKSYNTVLSTEDTIDFLYPFVMKDIVFINKPSYIFTHLFNDDGIRNSCTQMVCDKRDVQIDAVIMYRIYQKQLEVLGNCMNTIEPIWFE